MSAKVFVYGIYISDLNLRSLYGDIFLAPMETPCYLAFKTCLIRSPRKTKFNLRFFFTQLRNESIIPFLPCTHIYTFAVEILTGVCA